MATAQPAVIVKTGPASTARHDNAVLALRDLIISGVLSPGVRLDETELCKTLGLSRAPLREAMKLLASEQLVHIRPHRGAYVAPLLKDETEDLFEVMATLDPLIGTMAAARGTAAELDHIARMQMELARHHAAREGILYFQVNQDIHRALLDATHMPSLIGAYAPLLHRMRRVRTLANAAGNREGASLTEHQDILDALLDRDGLRLAHLLPAHTRATAAAVLSVMAAS